MIINTSMGAFYCYYDIFNSQTIGGTRLKHLLNRLIA